MDEPHETRDVELTLLDLRTPRRLRFIVQVILRKNQGRNDGMEHSSSDRASLPVLPAAIRGSGTV